MKHKQTAVEFLLAELDIAHLIAREKLTMAGEVVRQAKKMEKEHIKNAFIDGEYQQGFELEAEQYYNETYGKE